MNRLPLTSLFNWIFYLNEKENLFYYEKNIYFFDISNNNKLEIVTRK